MCGQPSTCVIRSRSMSASVAPGSNCSSNTAWRRRAMAAISVKLNPPTQKSGIGV